MSAWALPAGTTQEKSQGRQPSLLCSLSPGLAVREKWLSWQLFSGGNHQFTAQCTPNSENKDGKGMFLGTEKATTQMVIPSRNKFASLVNAPLPYCVLPITWLTVWRVKWRSQNGHQSLDWVRWRGYEVPLPWLCLIQETSDLLSSTTL